MSMHSRTVRSLISEPLCSIAPTAPTLTAFAGAIPNRLDVARVRARQAEHHVDRGRLPGSVGSEQRHRLTGRDVEGDATYGLDRAEGLDEVQQPHACGPVEGWGTAWSSSWSQRSGSSCVKSRRGDGAVLGRAQRVGGDRCQGAVPFERPASGQRAPTLDSGRRRASEPSVAEPSGLSAAATAAGRSRSPTRPRETETANRCQRNGLSSSACPAPSSSNRATAAPDARQPLGVEQAGRGGGHPVRRPVGDDEALVRPGRHQRLALRAARAPARILPRPAGPRPRRRPSDLPSSGPADAIGAAPCRSLIWSSAHRASMTGSGSPRCGGVGVPASHPVPEPVDGGAPATSSQSGVHVEHPDHRQLARRWSARCCAPARRAGRVRRT